MRHYPVQVILLGIMITFREELDTRVQDSKKKTTKSKKIMLIINSIKEFKNIVKNDPEFK
jgi:hypothetical protein